MVDLALDLSRGHGGVSEPGGGNFATCSRDATRLPRRLDAGANVAPGAEARATSPAAASFAFHVAEADDFRNMGHV